MADPAKIIEPRLLALLLSLLLAIGVALFVAVPPPRYAGDPAVVLTAEGAPRQAEAKAALRACQRAGAYGECMLWVFDQTRDTEKMPAFAREYVRLTAR